MVTVKITGCDVDRPKDAGAVGVNIAVSRCDPTANLDVLPDAVPSLETVTGLPRLVTPSLNCTVPTASAGLILAVNVTRLPWATGEAGDVLSPVAVATLSGSGNDMFAYFFGIED
jgi:hypothetical protein